jgi:FkbM family methyltransferase
MPYQLVDCKRGRFLVNPNDQYVGRSLIKYGQFSEGEADLFDMLIPDGGVVLEIGANIGAHTIQIAQRAKAVFAFEPQRLIFQMLCANLALNDIHNVIAINGAVGSAPGKVSIPVLSPDYSNNFGALGCADWGQGEDVRLYTIDGMGLADVHFMKIDVEGMEEDVLRGAAMTIRAHRPIIYYECDREDKRDSLNAYLPRFDYDLWWHLTMLFDGVNYRNDPENVFGNCASFNVLAVPKEYAFQCELPRVE